MVSQVLQYKYSIVLDIITFTESLLAEFSISYSKLKGITLQTVIYFFDHFFAYNYGQYNEVLLICLTVSMWWQGKNKRINPFIQGNFYYAASWFNFWTVYFSLSTETICTLFIYLILAKWIQKQMELNAKTSFQYSWLSFETKLGVLQKHPVAA